MACSAHQPAIRPDHNAQGWLCCAWYIPVRRQGAGREPGGNGTTV